jgi:hypothetical protein
MNLQNNTGLPDLVPSEFFLAQNYPNPFCEKTAIKLCVAHKTRVILEVFNSDGKLVRTLMDEEKEVGTYEVEFSAGGGSASNGDACNLSEGTYVYRLQAGGFLASRRMLLLRQERSPCASS